LGLEATAGYDPFEPGLSDLMLALGSVYLGQLDRYLEVTTRLATRTGSAQAYGITALVDGLQASGRIDEACELTDRALAAARAQGNPYWIAYSLWVCGGVYAKADPDRARATWRGALDYVRKHRVSFFEGFLTRDAARLEAEGPDVTAALNLFASSVDALQRAGNVAQLGITLATAPALFERLGELETAAITYGGVTGDHGGAHHVPELPDVGRRLRSALGNAVFEQRLVDGGAMDMNETADFVRVAIERLRNGQAVAAAQHLSRPAGLSRREVEVLRLLAGGMTTKEIAEQLFISAKTADNHIQHVYAKIGVSTRAQAALWAGEHSMV
jgi:DNA-binding CsgD family transcriptional regulator